MKIEALLQREAAKLLGKTTRTLRSWESDGDEVPRNEDGSYPGPELVAWYVVRSTAGQLDPNQERARRDHEHANKLAMENAVRRGELIEVSVNIAAFQQVLSALRAAFLAFPMKLTPHLDGDPLINGPVLRGGCVRLTHSAGGWRPQYREGYQWLNCIPTPCCSFAPSYSTR